MAGGVVEEFGFGRGDVMAELPVSMPSYQFDSPLSSSVEASYETGIRSG